MAALATLLLALLPTPASAVTTLAALQAALCAGGGAEVEVTGNITGTTSVLTVDDDCTATLDLNGKTLTVQQVVLGAGAVLTIKDSAGGGELIANATDADDEAGISTTGATLRIESGIVTATGGDGGAGIGGGIGGDGGSVAISGGSVTAIGGILGAGIGGGEQGDGGSVAISGGDVTATGGINGAGIGGGGAFGGDGGAGGSVVISGGDVTATGGINGAGIGGGIGGDGGSVTIRGGSVTATGGDGGAGIGGGDGGDGGSVTISDGVVVAIGGDGGGADFDGGAGIGGGIEGDGGSVTISGGVVTATGGKGAAGIGGAALCDDCTGGSVEISGGTVTAWGGDGGAGIGGGEEGVGGSVAISGGSVTAEGGVGAAGIGGGLLGHGGSVTISGGVVTATGGLGGAGIGGGEEGDGGEVEISGGTVRATAGSDGAEPIGWGIDGNEETGTVTVGPAAIDSTVGLVRSISFPSPPVPPVSVSSLRVVCGPEAMSIGATMVCTVSDGDPGIDILWRAAYNPVIAEAGVMLDASGSGTFSFLVPAAALGQVITVELVEWTAPISLGVVGGPVPTSVPSGEGPVTVWSLVLVLLVGGLVVVRRPRGASVALRRG